jgi:hypothetical protein
LVLVVSTKLEIQTQLVVMETHPHWVALQPQLAVVVVVDGHKMARQEPLAVAQVTLTQALLLVVQVHLVKATMAVLQLVVVANHL